MIRVQSSCSEISQCFLIDERSQFIIIQDFNLLDFMANTETIEEVDERNAAFDGSQMSDAGKIHDFLCVSFSQHSAAGSSCTHYILMIAKNGQSMVGQCTGSDMENNPEEVRQLLYTCLEKGFTFFHFMIDLTGGPCVAKRLSGCGSGTEYLAVTPWGDLYPCHQFVGEEDFLMGNVYEGVKKDEIVKNSRHVNVYSKEECKCFARFYCSGGCSANSYNFNGTIDGTYEIGCK